MSAAAGNIPLYRPNVAMVILNRHNLVFWAKRKGIDAWQFPQGGIGKHETPEQAMGRELQEETGLELGNLEPLAATRGWLRYVIPEPLRRGKFIGQEQKWFLLRLHGPDSLVNLNSSPGNEEFSEWKWESPATTVEQAAVFKRDAYRSAMREFAGIINATPG